MKEVSISVLHSKQITRIDISGPLSALPSNNRKTVARGRLIKDPKALKLLANLTKAFCQECLSSSAAIHYGETPVHVLMILGERYDSLGRRISRWDSHNMSKVASDWLQSVGILDDDSRAEVWCVKRKDYFGDLEPITTLIIQPQALIQFETQAFVKRLDEITRG